MDWRSAWSNVRIVIINVNSSYYKAFFAVYATTIKKLNVLQIYIIIEWNVVIRINL